MMRTAFFSFLIFCCIVDNSYGQSPVANFNATNRSGCASLNVQFQNTSTNNAVNKWYFGDGTSSSAISPSHVYAAAGSYQVKLVVTSLSSQKDSITKMNFVTVSPKPAANFSVNQNQACVGSNVFTFLNQSLNFDSCVWDFGDGTVSYSINPIHTYSNSGTYTVKLVVYNSNYSCSDVMSRAAYIVVRPNPSVSFTVDTTQTCDLNHQFQFSATTIGLSSWIWDFGDGTTTSAANPAHIYGASGNYDVSFVGTTIYGCSDTMKRLNYVQVNANPDPIIIVSDSGGCAPFNAQFQGIAQNASSFAWNFGNGNTSSLQSPTYKYNQTGIYNVTLNVNYSNGCSNNAVFNSISVDQTPVPGFTMSSFSGCKPFTPVFTNTTVGNFDWLWDFGDGTTSDLKSPSHTYTNSGLFSVKLTASYASGCAATYAFPFQVTVQGPQPVFSVNNNSGCPPLPVSFINQTTGTNTWHWNFGDGTTSSAANPTHTYQNIGNYLPYLIATDVFGCADTVYLSNQIQLSIPVSNFPMPTPVFGCSPFTIQLSDGGGGANSWLWDFGDGTTSSSPSPTHTYTVPGTYTVSLNTQSNAGYCAQSIANYAQFIVGGGEAKFSYIQSYCQPYTAVFTDSSTNAIAWFWEFGDDDTSHVQHPTHIYSNPGYYDVKLTITTADGCKHTTTHRFAVNFMPLLAFPSAFSTDTVLPISVNFAANTVGATAWFWTFGDGGSSNLENPVHTYTAPGPFTITLTISNDTCSRTFTYASTPISSGTIPIISGTSDTIKYSKIEGGCTPLRVYFNNPILNTVSITWDFGDGSTSNANNPTHNYTIPGSYELKIYYELSNGLKDTFQHPDPIVVVSPITDFVISQSGGCIGNSVALNVYDGAPVNFLWNFGDSTTSTVPSPVHTYQNSNQNYAVSLLVTDTFGCANYIVKTVYNQLNLNPASSDIQRACASDTVWFSSGPSSYSGYLWHFGDGDSSLSANPYHVYLNAGNFQVTLTVLDSQNCEKVYSLAYLIEISKPFASFKKGWTASVCTRVTQMFKNQSTGYSSCLWDFGDGTFSTATDPIHHYYNAGTYTVTLTVFGNNCSDIYILNNAVIFPNANADFSVVQDKSCLPVTATFNNLSVDAVSYLWEFGDGTTSSAVNPVHIYSGIPSANIKLTVTDTNGCSRFKTEPNITVVKNAFGFSTVAGCNPLTVQFTDTSANVSSLLWDFGDGSSTTGNSPSHTYNQNGVYGVQLIATAPDGCTDTLQYDSLITVSIPTADFNMQNPEGCKPLLVKMFDGSDRATVWNWDFGDGTSSVIKNPTHLYDSAGVYDIQLIVEDALGCLDTVRRSSAVVAKGPDAGFSMSMLSTCPVGGVQFNDSSKNAVSWSWDFGDGGEDSIQNPLHNFEQPGIYTITLSVYDTAGCISTISTPMQTFFSNPTKAAATRSDSLGCAPLSVLFMDKSIAADSLLWVFGDGSFSKQSNPNHVYTNAGIYQASLIAFNSSGCHDTLYFGTPIEVKFQPVADFAADPLEGCMPLGVSFTNLSVVDSTSTFSWSFGNGSSSIVKDPFETYMLQGVYDVTLVVSNDSMCFDTLIKPAYIKVFDNQPPLESPLYKVDVIDNRKIEITWQNSAAIDLGKYILLRFNARTLKYDTVFVDLNPANISFDLTSNYVDSNVNTLDSIYTYKLSTTDLCDNSLPLNQLKAHSSINIEADASGPDIYVSWNPYGGCNVAAYDLYRRRTNELSFSLLRSLGPTTLYYLDTSLTCPVMYYYKVVARDLCGRVISASSDTSGAQPDIELKSYELEIIRSTVVNNSFVYTEWSVDPAFVNELKAFELFRSTNGSIYQPFAIVPAVQTSFIDKDVDVHNMQYQYMVRALSECDLAGALSSQSSSILLKAANENGKVRLRWTPYRKWDTGVKKYVIEKMNRFGVWERVQIIDGTIHEWLD